MSPDPFLEALWIALAPRIEALVAEKVAAAGKRTAGEPSDRVTVEEACRILGGRPRSYVYDGFQKGRFTRYGGHGWALLDRAEVEAHRDGESYPAQRGRARRAPRRRL